MSLKDGCFQTIYFIIISDLRSSTRGTQDDMYEEGDNGLSHFNRCESTETFLVIKFL